MDDRTHAGPNPPTDGPSRKPARHQFARARHARYVESGVVYHIISRTRGNLFLLKPDLVGKLRGIIAGVLAEAKRNWPSVANFGSAFLSNHVHVLLSVNADSGDPRDLVDYVGFVKREVSRRWKGSVEWHGSIWEGFHCTAVITPRAQVRALRYVLAQSVKEDLVEDPRMWPGFHCVEALVTGKPVAGVWFDGTRYGKAVHAERAKNEENRREVRRENYLCPRSFEFDSLPALAHLGSAAYRETMADMVEKIVRDGAESRRERGVAVMGVRAVCEQSPLTSRPVPLPEWFEDRRRMIFWDDPSDDDVKAYLSRYWEHQVQFRAAADHWRGAKVETGIAFPVICSIPGRRTRPISHMEQSSA